jgi:hypothetical protein
MFTAKTQRNTTSGSEKSESISVMPTGNAIAMTEGPGLAPDSAISFALFATLRRKRRIYGETL